MKNKLCVLFVSLFSVCFAEQQPLVVGTVSGYAPFVSLDSQGRHEGFDIDVVQLLADKLNRKLVIKDCGSMPSLMLALKQKKVDILIWAISITEDRMKQMEMVYYQGEKVTDMPFLFWKQIPENVQTIDDLAKDAKKAVCVEAGTFQEGVLKKVTGINLKYLDKIDDAILEIRYGKSFATTVDPSLVSRFKTRYPEVKVINLPLPSKDYALGNGICIHKGNEQLAAQVRQAICQIANEGKFWSWKQNGG